jgi:hypothetical protein
MTGSGSPTEKRDQTMTWIMSAFQVNAEMIQ